MLFSAARSAAVVVLVSSLAGCGATRRPDGGEGLLAVGADAPNLPATDQNGKEHRLADERGHAVVVYFCVTWTLWSSRPPEAIRCPRCAGLAKARHVWRRS